MHVYISVTASNRLNKMSPVCPYNFWNNIRTEESWTRNQALLFPFLDILDQQDRYNRHVYMKYANRR